MAVRVSRISDDIPFEFSCAQWSVMSDDSKAEWEVTDNTCGVQTSAGSPYAASEFLYTLSGLIAVEYPLVLSVVDGVYTISVVLPEWHTFKGTISANKIIVTGFTLPSDINAVFPVVRKQWMMPTDDFTIDTGDNSVNFNAGLGLNGQIAYIRAYV